MASVAKFAKAPLSEVVCGVGINVPDFSSIHFGLYWESIRKRFPNDPLDRPPVGSIDILASMPSFRRVWFESADRKQLIQLQSDRFHYNWRRLAGQNEYPHFESLYPSFKEEWTMFQEWWLDLEYLPIQPTYYELTYLNQFDTEFDWKNAKDSSTIFTFLDLAWADSLPHVISHDCNFLFELPESKGKLILRLNQIKRKGDEVPMLLLELTARSANCDLSIDNWFSDAHDSIVRTFIELLTDKAKMDWGLKWL